jgi:hypothetical protein
VRWYLRFKSSLQYLVEMMALPRLHLIVITSTAEPSVLPDQREAEDPWA